MSRCCRNWSAPWDRNGTLLVQQQLSCGIPHDWLDGVSGSGPIRGGRWGEKQKSITDHMNGAEIKWEISVSVADAPSWMGVKCHHL